MTTTQTRVLPELDEALDFEPTCVVGEATGDPDCTAPADWIAVVVRCGCVRMYCDLHLQEVLSYRWKSPVNVTCPGCNSLFTITSGARGCFSRIERIR